MEVKPLDTFPTKRLSRGHAVLRRDVPSPSPWRRSREGRGTNGGWVALQDLGPFPGETTGQPSKFPGDGVDLDAEERAQVDRVFEETAGGNPYVVLSVARTADAKEIKRAYHRLSKEFHPDRYYRRNLGPYKEKLEILFGRLAEAYRVLSNPDTRRELDLAQEEAGSVPEARMTLATREVNFVPGAGRLRLQPVPVQSAMLPRKQDKAPPPFIARFQKQMAEKLVKARGEFESGMKAFESQQFGPAAAHFQLASTLDDRNERAKEMFKRAQDADRNSRAEEFYRQAKTSMAQEAHKEAAQWFQKAIDCRPTRGKYYNEFGKLIWQHTVQQRAAIDLLRRAVEVEPARLEFVMDLARSYEEVGMPSNAVRAFERVLQLDARNAEAAKALKRLR